MNTKTLLLLGWVVGCGTQSAPPPSAPEAPPAPAPAAPAEAHATLISGTIEAPADAPEARAVYVSLKVVGRPGPPLAAKRLPAGPFPLSFELTEADRPMALGEVPDEVQLKVTLDIDGDPMVKADTDLVSITTVSRAAGDVSVTLAPR